MRPLLLAIFAAVVAAAQAAPTLTLSTASPIYLGSTVAMTVTLSGSSGAALAGIQFTLPTGSTSPALGSAATAAGKFLYTSSTNANNLVVIGAGTPAGGNYTVNATPLADGVILTFSYPIPKTPTTSLNLSLSNVFGGNSAGAAVTLSAPTFSAPVLVNPTCVSSIQAAITTTSNTPTQANLLFVLTDILAAMTGGTCQ